MKAILSKPIQQTSPLARAAFAKLHAAATMKDEIAVAKAMGRADDLMRIIQKGAIGPATTATDADLISTDFGNYLGWLAPDSAAARMISLGLNLPIRGGSFKAPNRDTAPATLPWVGEADPIAVRDATFANVTMTPKQMAAISVISREVAKQGAGESVVTSILREDGAKSLDAGYFSAATTTDIIHPGLLAGLTAIPGYGGGDLTAFEADIEAMLSVVAPNGSGNIVLITGQLRAQKIALKFPDFKIPVFPSLAVADTRLIMVDAGALVHSFGGFEIDISRDATIHMSDEPLEIVSATGPATADPVRSLYQTDAWGLRILGDVAFAARKTNAVAFVESMSW